uniref:Ciliogenesis and planar polarity effector 2 n=1 Tax=Sander lucioperca TaxID=283035 RepID=A0A8C9YPA3_SANLU
MAQVPPSSGSIVVADWHRCKDSKEYFSKILHKKRRKNFGLLESPLMPPHVAVDTVHYKIFISGKSGVGKTALAARLAGQNIPNMTVNIPHMHYETTGIEMTMVYWPVKLRENGRVLFFRLQLWDCGENVLRRFDHLLGYLYIFAKRKPVHKALINYWGGSCLFSQSFWRVIEKCIAGEGRVKSILTKDPKTPPVAP